MKRFAVALAPGQIAAVCGGEFKGDAAVRLRSVADPSEADAASIVFLEQDKYLEAVAKCPAGLVFCTAEGAERLAGRNLLIHPKPYFALMRLVSWWLEQGSAKPAPGVHPTAVVDPSASLGKDVHIGAFCVIGKSCRIGDHAIIESGCVIGDDTSIGCGTRLYPRVVVYHECLIGSGVIIHSGTVIGADGFGFILMDGIQHKIPQVGNVVIGDNVEIGANTAIDRATLGSTIVGEGTKIDNCVQIGHNCRIGRHSILCAQVGLAGSTIVGDYVYLAGQVGAAGHISIGDRAMIGAQSGLTRDIPADASYLGTPAMEANAFKRIFITQKHLPEMYRHYRSGHKREGD
jgi:UDP-3-O-[3-hydroxymyristoyl] glucosamine N-acyltransferase